MAMYGEGSRALQGRYNARDVADLIEKATCVSSFDDDQFGYRDFVESATYFFLATSSGENTDCSFKGGPEGFIKITGPNTIIFPDYDGNRMYKSLGNIIDNPNIGMLFLRFDNEEGNRYLRVRINGKATVHDDHPLKQDFAGAKRIVEVETQHIYLNCPRYIPEMTLVEQSAHIPQHGKEQPVPSWKMKPGIKEALEGSE
ncbi:pyridoxamine 5'-phosphate oxidase family protein [Marinovum sp. 2_MG-2023]|uniref:pyridoxamine 5'-phosphate oxidase family protein n=1 Tax=unclassified Marinovum TaxID=2647166 RepID=UPI0026E2C358|nr:MULTISPECIES: pyridoxamine 5'-phosphate oxidase family protein [unclassified Marinovum]MDO6732366.1 pyridoxamine 5'-phosphate oxidase family protein [Marinovum sp. 2_MG-2023]MDO6781683.1 pyridoxamine 5'-phosphate oxidase family protein [Marinovum sp. 1_MG-2023]